MGGNSGGGRGRGRNDSNPPGANFTSGKRGGGRGNRANDPRGGSGNARAVGGGGARQDGGRGKRDAPNPSAPNVNSQKRDAQTASSRGSAKRGQGPDNVSGGKGTVQAAQPTPQNSIPRYLKQLWYREGRCMSCGDSSHRRAECPNAIPSGSSQPTNSSSVSSTKAVSFKPSTTATKPSDQRGIKRSRDATSSGLTPPAKKGTAKVLNTKPVTDKFAYATAAKESLGLVIRNQDGSHITRVDFYKLQEAATACWLEHEKNTGDSLFTVETWEYTSTYANALVLDSTSAKKLAEVIERGGFKVVDREEHLSTLKPKKVMSGLLRNPLSTRPKEELERYIKLDVKAKKIPGTVEYFGETMTKQNNKILRIRVDEEAAEFLNQTGNTLSFAAFGKVLFADLNKKKLSPTDKLVELAKRIETGKKMIAELERQQELELKAAKSEAETIGSLGATNLNLGGSEVDEPKPNQEEEEMDESEAMNLLNSE